MSSIPNAFGGFAPFPNTIMIPTMGLQSDVIGFRFGFGYEKGKRTLRAMSNEQFNTLNEEAEQAIYKEHDTTAINFFKMEMIRWVELQTIIIEKSVEIETMKAQRTPSALREIFEGFTKGFSTQQKNDAKNFFSSLTDPIMKIMAWFSGQPNVAKPTDQSIIKINPLTGLPWGTPAPPATNIPSPQPTFTPPTSTPSQGINPKITQTDVSQGLPRAGQTQILARNKLIKDIAAFGIAIKNMPNTPTHRDRRNGLIGSMKILQTNLSALLIRYRWI